jgi:hypothetical protein
VAIDGGLRNIFRTYLQKLGYHFTAIETGGTGRGIPDSEYCSPTGETGWIEYKKTSANSIQISPEQIGWALQRSRNQGVIFYGVRKKCAKGVRRRACDELWLIDGASAQLLKEEGLKSRELKILGIWANGPANWDWQQIDRILRRK